MLRFHAVFALLALAPVVPAFAGESMTRAAEPSYVMTLPGGETLRATLETMEAPGGGKIVRVRAAQRPKVIARVDCALRIDAAGQVTHCRTDAHTPAGSAVVLEALRKAGNLIVQIPEQTGTLPVGAPVVTSLDALAFIGKRYNFAKGGVQHFALLVDFGPELTRLVNMTLEAAGTEPLSLDGGTVTARKLKLTVELPFLPKEAGAGVLYTGPQGEVLRAEAPLLGVAMKAKGPATAEGEAIVTRLASPRGVVRIARTAEGFETTIERENGGAIGSVTTDAAYRPLRLRHTLRGREFAATITTTELRWRLAAGEAQAPSVTGDPWFLPHYLATDLWEKAGALAALRVGEKGQGTYLPLETGNPTGAVFTAERLPDTSLARADGDSIALRHWRLTYRTGVYDLWTDGTRLIKLASSEGHRITREGWEKATAALKAPEAPAQPAAPAAP